MQSVSTEDNSVIIQLSYVQKLYISSIIKQLSYKYLYRWQ